MSSPSPYIAITQWIVNDLSEPNKVIRQADVDEYLRLKRVPGDGNCFFHAVATAMSAYIHHSSSGFSPNRKSSELSALTASALRRRLCEYYHEIDVKIADKKIKDKSKRELPNFTLSKTQRHIYYKFMSSSRKTSADDTDPGYDEPHHQRICSPGVYASDDMDVIAMTDILRVNIAILRKPTAGGEYTVSITNCIDPEDPRNVPTIFIKYRGVHFDALIPKDFASRSPSRSPSHSASNKWKALPYVDKTLLDQLEALDLKEKNKSDKNKKTRGGKRTFLFQNKRNNNNNKTRRCRRRRS